MISPISRLLNAVMRPGQPLRPDPSGTVPLLRFGCIRSPTHERLPVRPCALRRSRRGRREGDPVVVADSMPSRVNSGRNFARRGRGAVAGSVVMVGDGDGGIGLAGGADGGGVTMGPPVGHGDGPEVLGELEEQLLANSRSSFPCEADRGAPRPTCRPCVWWPPRSRESSPPTTCRLSPSTRVGAVDHLIAMAVR